MGIKRPRCEGGEGRGSRILCADGCLAAYARGVFHDVGESTVQMLTI